MDATVATGTETDIERIIAELDAGIHRLPVEAIRAARQHREQIVPRLIEVIRAASAAARAGNPPEGNAHFFALFMLTEFQAKEALPAILEAISLPGDLPFDLFGGAITSVLARVLAALSGDQPEVMDDLVRNRDLNEYVRWEAADSFLVLVRDGRMTRDEAVRRLRQHLREAIEFRDDSVAGPLVSVLDYIGPQEALEEIEEAFRLELIELFMINLGDVERSIAEGQSAIDESLRRRKPSGIPDTIAELDKWASFQERPRMPKTLPLPRAPLTSRASPIPQSILHLPSEESTTVRTTEPRIGRNDPCPCGSGRKYKKCCGAPK